MAEARKRRMSASLGHREFSGDQSASVLAPTQTPHRPSSAGVPQPNRFVSVMISIARRRLKIFDESRAGEGALSQARLCGPYNEPPIASKD